MSELLQNLKQFNRKERFYLVTWALGSASFGLSATFRKEVGRILGITIPAFAFTAMDYHLDWLYASLHLSENRGTKEPHCNDKKMIHAQQEDIDLMVAFEEGDRHHIVLLEAKGATPFSNSQLRSKAIRLGDIFGDGGDRYSGVVPHFVTASPRASQGISTSCWPTWMSRDGKPIWIELPMPSDLQKVTRCTAAGVVSIGGDHWRVIPDRGSYERELNLCARLHQEAESTSSILRGGSRE